MAFLLLRPRVDATAHAQRTLAVVWCKSDPQSDALFVQCQRLVPKLTSEGPFANNWQTLRPQIEKAGVLVMMKTKRGPVRIWPVARKGVDHAPEPIRTLPHDVG